MYFGCIEKFDNSLVEVDKLGHNFQLKANDLWKL